MDPLTYLMAAAVIICDSLLILSLYSVPLAFLETKEALISRPFSNCELK